MSGGPEIAQEQQDDHHDQADGQRQREFHVLHGGANGLGAVDDRVEPHARRNDRREGRHGGLDLIDRIDDVGARLLEHQQDDRRLVARQRRDVDVLRPRYRVTDVADPDRRAVAVGDDDVVIVLRLLQLVIGRDGEALPGAVDAALAGVGVGDGEHAAHVLERKPARLQLRRIDLDADGRLLLAADDDLGDAGDLRNLLRHDRVGKIVDGRERQRVRMGGQDEDRRIRRIDLAIGRRRGQRGRQLAAGGGDRGLHVLGGRVDVAVEIELQRDGGRAEHADRGHLSDAGNLSEPALERRRHGRCHGVGTGARRAAPTPVWSGNRPAAAAPPATTERPPSRPAPALAISRDVAIGRRMKGSEMFTSACPAGWPLRRSWRRPARRLAAGIGR